MTTPHFADLEILHLWTLTRDYADPLDRAVIRELARRSVTHSNGLIGTVTLINAPTTEAMVNLWLPKRRGVDEVRAALDRLIVAGALTEARIGNVTQLTIAPAALPVDSRDSAPVWSLGLEAA